MRPLFLAAFLVTLVVAPAFAQQGQINGLITDSTGGVVPGVTVTATETATGFERTVVSGTNGNYVFTQMRPTSYEIKAELTGFRTFIRKGIDLQANQALTVNVSMAIGNLEESVTVAGAAATVDVTTATIAEVVDHTRIVELPINGRDAAKLVQLVAGTIVGSISTETGKSIPGGLRLSTNGSNEKDVSFRLDGAVGHRRGGARVCGIDDDEAAVAPPLGHAAVGGLDRSAHQLQRSRGTVRPRRAPHKTSDDGRSWIPRARTSSLCRPDRRP